MAHSRPIFIGVFAMTDDTDTATDTTSAPSREHAVSKAELFIRAREAVAALRGAGRQTNGQAGPGNTLNLRTGLWSMQLLEQPDIAAWHREQVEAISTDLGGVAELSALPRFAPGIKHVETLQVCSTYGIQGCRQTCGSSPC
jgi:hypothetical protein